MIIYKIYNDVNDKIYIGQTIKTMENRWKGHIQCAKEGVNRHLYNAMRKYGIEKFHIVKIAEANSKEELNKLETFYIMKYDSVKNGYNMGYGGDNNVMFSDKVKQKHDDKMRSPEVRKKISETMLKYRKENPFTEETRKKISKKLMGNKNGTHPDNRSIPVFCIYNGNKYLFKSKKEGGKWWFNTEPFTERYIECVYYCVITDSINGKELKYRQEPINQNISWFLQEGE